MRFMLMALAAMTSPFIYPQTDPDLSMIDETVLQNSTDVIEERDHRKWLEHIDTSSCVTRQHVDRIRQFILEEAPVSPYEIQVLDGIPIDRLACLIRQLVEAENAPLSIGHQAGSYVSMMLRQSSSARSVYEGHKALYGLFRARISVSPRLSFGLMYEKDAGEALWNKSGPEYLSGYIRLRPENGIFKEIILGDHRLSLGQGMLFNNYYRKGLSFNRDVIPKYQGSHIAPYHSLDENRAIRGIAVSAHIDQSWRLNASLSYRQLDARMDSVTGNISSLPLSGKHISPTEISGKNAAGTFLSALAIEYHQLGLRVSLQALYQRFQDSLTLNNRLYSQFRANAQNFGGASIAYDWNKGPLNLYGEWTLDRKGVPSGISGILWAPDIDHRISMIFRHLPSRFYQLNNQTLSYGTGQNETGFFIGYSASIGRKWYISINADTRINKWWSYLNSPFRRSDQASLSVRLKERKHYDTYVALRFLERHKSAHSTSERKWQTRWHLKYIINRGIEWRMRIQFSYHDDLTNSWGWLTYQELKYKVIGSQWSVTTRFTRYHILDYGSRIYAYEIRPGNLFAMPAFSGQGANGFVNLKYSLGNWQLGAYYSFSSNTRSSWSGAIFIKYSLK